MISKSRFLFDLFVLCLLALGLFIFQNSFLIHLPFFKPDFAKYPEKYQTAQPADRTLSWPESYRVQNEYSEFHPLRFLGLRLGSYKVLIKRGVVLRVTLEPPPLKIIR